MNDSGTKSRYTGVSVLIFFHVAALYIGFTILAAVFEFPEVLRESARYRLELYLANQSIVRPVFWLLAVAGLTQIAVAVFLFYCLRNHGKILQKIAVVFGMLAGIFQTMGFIGLNTLPSWLGLYAAALCLGLWTAFTGAAMLAEQRLFDRKIGAFGVAAGCVMILLALGLPEVAPSALALIVDYGFPAWAVWLVVVAVSLLKTDPDGRLGPLYGWKSFCWSASLYALMILPNLML